MDVLKLLEDTIEKRASDLHITVGLPPMMRIDGRLTPFGDKKLSPVDTEEYINLILKDRQREVLDDLGQIDFSYSIPGWGRFRVNAYKQRGSYAIAFRLIPTGIPTLEELNLPATLEDFTNLTRGLILVTGPTGSGKSTTLASLINIINEKRNEHILTLEDPIEYLHSHKNSVVNQREMGNDSNNYAGALRAALRQDPDVILIGEMRDLETISIAITAAETGHLVLSTLHTVGAAKTIDRIIDVFPPYQQQQVKVQLASVLQGVVSQQLFKRKNEPGRVAALEIMKATPAIRNLIREGKAHQIQSSIQMGAKLGMVTMDAYILELYRKGNITQEDALLYSVDHESMKSKLYL